jgi:hypothetical protein
MSGHRSDSSGILEVAGGIFEVFDSPVLLLVAVVVALAALCAWLLRRRLGTEVVR